MNKLLGVLIYDKKQHFFLDFDGSNFKKAFHQVTSVKKKITPGKTIHQFGKFFHSYEHQESVFLFILTRQSLKPVMHVLEWLGNCKLKWSSAEEQFKFQSELKKFLEQKEEKVEALIKKSNGPNMNSLRAIMKIMNESSIGLLKKNIDIRDNQTVNSLLVSQVET